MHATMGGGVNLTQDSNAFFSTTYPSGTNQYISTGNPFSNLAAFDASLPSAVASTMKAGTTLNNAGGQTFNLDVLGKTRGADGKWDRGAIEFSGAGETMPSPTNLQVQ